MNRHSKLIIGSAAGLTLILMAWPSRKPEAEPEPAVSANLESAPSAPAEYELDAASAEQLAAQAARSASLAWGRDPFAPPEPEPAAIVLVEPPLEIEPPPVEPVVVAKPRLTGLSERGAERWAIIDGEVVQEGDWLSSGHRVARIAGRSVTVLMHREELTLELGERP